MALARARLGAMSGRDDLRQGGEHMAAVDQVASSLVAAARAWTQACDLSSAAMAMHSLAVVYHAQGDTSRRDEAAAQALGLAAKAPHASLGAGSELRSFVLGSQQGERRSKLRVVLSRGKAQP